VALFVNQGGDPLQWSKTVLSDSMSGARYATMADLDGDGALDVAAADWEGQVVWWPNSGDDPAQWSPQVVDSTCLGGHYVVARDLDGDGANDLLVVAYELDSVFWYRNGGGDPITWTRHVVADGVTQVLTAFPGDIDGDGDLDVVGSAAGLGQFAWWEISDFVPEGRLTSSVVDLGVGQESAALDWDAVTPPGTTLGLACRSSDDAGDLGPWSEALSSAGEITPPPGRFFQYRVEMETTEPDVSPILHELSLTSTPAPEECVPGSTTMCLNQGRFRVEVQWTDFEGGSGAGQVASVGSDDSGLFWFFGPDNWEMLVKVLDGCGVNQHYWVFAAATTTVGYTLRVVDCETGQVSAYTNELGVSSPAITDTVAFPGCP